MVFLLLRYGAAGRKTLLNCHKPRIPPRLTLRVQTLPRGWFGRDGFSVLGPFGGIIPLLRKPGKLPKLTGSPSKNAIPGENDIKTVSVFLSQLLIGAILFEGMLAALLFNTSLILPLPDSLKEPLRYIYFRGLSEDVQFDPDCAHYDPEVTYLLNNHPCTFRGIEFSTTVQGNSVGLRDDEPSLLAPEIIVVGDSWSFGWGVEERESFPSIIEEKLNAKILNTGVPSFGTVREMRLLSRVDTSNVKLVILQYCKNDYKENRALFEKGGLKIRTKEQYDYIVQKKFPLSRKYYPLKYFWITLEYIGMSLKRIAQRPPDISPVDAFLRVVKSGLPNLPEGTQILLFELSAPISPPDLRTDSVDENELREAFAPYPVTFVSMNEVLDNSDYFPLDQHLNPIGQQKVAKKLLGEMPALLSWKEAN